MTYDFLGSGLKFPLRFELNAAEVSHDHEHIQESIIQILGTRPGERFMKPEFGSKLKDLVFEQNDDVLKGLIRHHVINAIQRWEKRVVIRNVNFDDSPESKDKNVLPLIISYRIIKDNVEGNLVYPFLREII